MVVKADQERIKSLLKDTITLLCKNGLNFKTEFSVEALIGITLDKEDVVLISINEIIHSELGAKLALARESGEKGLNIDNGENSETDSHPASPASNNGHRRRKRKHSPQRNIQPVEDGESEEGDYEQFPSNVSNVEDSSSEVPPSKRIPDDVMIKGENDKDIIYIKEEADAGDWPASSRSQDSYGNIPPQSSSGGPGQTSNENFDFLHGGSLVPMNDGSGPPPWSADVSPSQSMPMMTPPKRTSTITGNSPSTPSDQSQSPTTSAAAAETPSMLVPFDPRFYRCYPCPACKKMLGTKQGLMRHMNAHYGNYLYQCPKCDKGVMSSMSLRTHLRVRHGIDEEKVSKYRINKG